MISILKKVKIFFIIIFSFLLALSNLFAQQGWNAVLNINPYPSPYISDWQNNPASLGSLTIFRTVNSSEQITISLTVTLNGTGEVFTGVTEPIDIPAVSSYVIDNTKITNIQNPSYPNSDLRAKSIQSGRLPEGEYSVCMTVLNNDNVVLVSNLCSNFTIVYPEPPQLIYPFNGDSLEVTTKYPTFQWSPVIVPPDYQITYTLKIAEILPGQTPFQALSANVPQYENKNITTTTLTYPIDALPLDTGKTYTWQVQALDQNGFPPSQNDGKSEIYTFNFKHPAAPNSQLLSGNLPVSFNCGCNAPSPVSNTVKTNFTLAADTTLKIGKFKLKISKISKQPDSEGKFSGEGTIPFPLINSSLVPLKVKFNDIQINNSNEVISGYASGIVSDNVDFLPAVQPPEFNTVPLTITDVQNLKQYFNKYPSQLASQAEAVKNSIGFDLPLGLDKQIAGKRIIIAVTGMTFTPKNAVFDAAVELDLPDATPNAIALGARNICIDQYNICGQGTMFLAKDLNFSIGKSQLTLKGYNNTNAKIDSGTYVEFDNNGFKNLRIQAEYDFPTSLLTGTDNTSPVKAFITANANSWTDWIGSIKINPFKISGVSDFTFNPGTGYYDHSDLVNPQKFPKKYLGSKATLWHGFFLPQLKITLPELLNNNNKAISIAADNLIIDDQGVSVTAAAKNILAVGNGNLSGWYYSIDSLSIEFVKNSLSNSGFGGKVVLPIAGGGPNNTGSQLNYTCNLSFDKNQGTKLQFLLHPKDNIDISLWKAKLSINKSSSMIVNFDKNNKYARMSLDGELDLVNDKPKIDFKAVSFQGMSLQTQKPYFNIKSLTAGFASPQKRVGGFPVSIKSIKPKIQGSEVGISVDLGFSLCKEIAAIPSAEFGFTVWGKIEQNPSTKRFTASYDKIDLNKIKLQGALGPVSVNGEVDFIHNKDLGDAVGGSIKADMLKGLTLSANVLFGHKDFNYWYVDATAKFGAPGPIPPIILPGTPFAIFGFGGGAYYHLAQKDPPNASALFKNKAVASEYVTDKTKIGFSATVILGTSSDNGEAIQANGKLTIQLNSKLGVDKVRFDVSAYMITPLMETQKAEIRGKGFIDMDFGNDIYHAGFAMNINVAGGIVDGSGDIDLLINASSGEWHLFIGTPSQRVSVIILHSLKTSAYFMVGSSIPDIPPPDIPSDIHLDKSYSQNRVPPIQNAGGLAFGASLNISNRFDFLIFYAKLEAGLGFDISVRKLTQGCKGSSAMPGINGWYANGQIYAYGSFDAGVHVDLWFYKGDISALKLQLATVFQLAGPNPTWFKGWVYGHYSVLNGIISGQMTFKVAYQPNGKCEPAYSTPFGNLPLITQVKPDEEKDVPIFANSEAAFTFPIGQKVLFDETDENGHTVTHNFRLLISRYDFYKGGKRVYGLKYRGNVNYTDNPQLGTYYPDVAFDPQSKYKIVVSVKVQEWNERTNRYEDVYMNGKIAEETKSATFTTGACIETLDQPGVVSSSYPFERQRFFLQEENNHRGFVLLSKSFPCLLYDNKYNLKAIFVSYVGGKGIQTHETNITISGKYLYFNIPKLANGTITQIKIVKRPKAIPAKSRTGAKGRTAIVYSNKYYQAVRVNSNGKQRISASTLNLRHLKIRNISLSAQDILLYSYFFRTSKFNTLNEKLANTSVNAKVSGGGMPYSKYTAKYKTAEGFDRYDAMGTIIKGAPDRYIRPLVEVKEDFRKDPWYKIFLIPLYNNAGKAYGKVLPKRTFYDCVSYGWYPPTGIVRLTYFSPKLSDSEISSVVNSKSTRESLQRNHSSVKINTSSFNYNH